MGSSRKVYLMFLDLKIIFDGVDREELMTVPQEVGIEENLVVRIRSISF